MGKTAIIISFLYLFVSCQEESIENRMGSEQNTLFTKVAQEASGIDFINQVKDKEDFNVLSYRNFYNGGGVAIGDINNDGLPDIFFTANMLSNKLYLNLGSMTFKDISESAGIAGLRGWSTGVSMVDINADGLLDIYVSNSGDIAGDNRTNELYINQGDLTFKEEAKKYNLDNAGFTTHASFFDYDQDGDLDCYILNNSFKDPKKISSFSKTREEDDQQGGDRLMRNDGETFTDVSLEAGIYTSAIGFGLGVSVSDLNHDLLPDIYISNDFWERDYIYINQGDGSFSEELTERVSICSVSSMGADIGDINNDGYPDVFTTDMLSADNYRLKSQTMFDPYFLENMKYRSSYHYQILQNCLQVNQGDGSFQERASMSGVSATDWSWGALIFDFDNDGWNDIYVCNGIYRDIMDQDFINFIDDKESVKKVVSENGRYDFRDFLEYLPSTPMRNYAFVNQHDTRFQNKAEALGFVDKEFSNGAAYGDLDRDGDLDLVINNVNMPASIYRNNGELSDRHYLGIDLRDPNSKNPLGIGAKVSVSTSAQKLTKQLYMNRGFQSSVDHTIIFGLGDQDMVTEVEVIWPDQTQQVTFDINTDTTLVITKQINGVKLKPVNSFDKTEVLTEATAVIEDGAAHREDTFNDFDRERLMHRMHSTEGPRIETGDLNGDGLVDFILLGAADDMDKVFIQNQNGTFHELANAVFGEDVSFESTCAALFDYDQDGDLDLVIGSGGNDLSKGMEGFLMRYYENNGQGIFSKRKEATPPAGGQFAVIAAQDYDQDGDIDLFVGARSIPGNYGLTPRSFLLERVTGGWKDVTEQSLGTLGMITDASWADLNGDDLLDLLIVGEWMPVTYFINTGSGLSGPNEIEDSEGWWLDICPADVDADGDLDFVLGNWGLNSKFKASPDRPLSLHVKDFDQNGKSEFVIEWYPPGDDQAYPFHSKMDMTDQIPSLKKRILKYADYAQMDFQTLFSPEERQGVKSYKAKRLQSSLLRNVDGQMILEDLPLDAQVTPIFASAVQDFDQDGYQDIWLGGNIYGLKPEVGRLNASKTILLSGSSDGSFTRSNNYLPSTSGEVRDVNLLSTATGKNIMLVARNNMKVKVLEY